MRHMKKILTVAAVCAAGQVFADGNSNTTPRIVNGDPANLSDWSFIVSLQDSTNFHFCGGSYIGNNIVITAAHCIDTSLAKPVNHIGFGNTNNKSQTTAAVGRVWVHPDYDPVSTRNDIAALEITGDVSGLTAISLADATTMSGLQFGDEFFVAGWGDTASGGTASNTLLEANLRYQDDAICTSKYFPRYTSAVNICAYDFEQDAVVSDSCQGDSGGPLVSRKDGNDVLVGVVSYGEGCAVEGVSGVYSKVSAYSGDWLTNVKNYFASGIHITHSSDALSDLLYRTGTSYYTDVDAKVKTINVENKGATAIALGNVYSDANSLTTKSLAGTTCENSTIQAGTNCDITLTLDTAAIHDNQEITSQTHFPFADFTLDYNTKYQIIEDIPAGSGLGTLEFNNFGYGLWAKQTTPFDYYQSPQIKDNEFSSLLTSGLAGSGTLTFEVNVNSEDRFDGISLLVDGDQYEGFLLSGACDWQTVTVQTPTSYIDSYGTTHTSHAIEISYTKDIATSEGSDNAGVRAVSFVPGGNFTEFSVSTDGTCDPIQPTPTATPTPTAAPTATATPTTAVTPTPTTVPVSSSGSFGFLIALLALPFIRFRKLAVSLLVVLGVTACGDKDADVAVMAEPVVKEKMALTDIETPKVEVVSDTKTIIKGEPLATFEYASDKLSFAVRDNGCTKSSDFRLELNDANELEVIRLKADDCRKATVWRVIKVAHGFPNNFTLVNPMVEANGPIIEPVMATNTGKPIKMR